ncbi:MAG: sulfate adenylyltransferase [Bacteroidetes bacterium]|nr:sulfate adenylyltransferase [Bacteroidota bacterium]
MNPQDHNETFSSRAYLDMELLRFTTAGSVDDGKSTLIGRLLYDSKSIFEDQLEAVVKASKRKGEDRINLALLTDGLRAEREQGITIDVAYRYFATPKRKFIIADTPGHIQYTRNMVTGASTANAALILIDARHGVIEQTHRHAFIASLLQIPHIIVCINKMDLVDYRESVFLSIRDHFSRFAGKINLRDIRFIPICALHGDNVVDPSANMDWYKEGTLMHLLENLPVENDQNLTDGRFPVQYIIRPEKDSFHDFRGYAGRIAGGVFHPGDQVVVLPSGISTKIRQIETFDGPLQEAFAPMSVILTLEDDIDISRGAMIVPVNNKPCIAQEIRMMICWMNERPLQLDKKYTLLHTTLETKCMIREVRFVVNVNSGMPREESSDVKTNDIASIIIKTARPVFFDPYSKNRITGSVILIDDATNETVAAGMINGNCP